MLQDQELALQFTTGVLVLLVTLWALLGRWASKLLRLNEGSVAAALGLLAAFAALAIRPLAGGGKQGDSMVYSLLAFPAESFFTCLLPPVIFFAGEIC